MAKKDRKKVMYWFVCEGDENTKFKSAPFNNAKDCRSEAQFFSRKHKCDADLYSDLHGTAVRFAKVVYNAGVVSIKT